MHFLKSILTVGAALAIAACGGSDERQVALAVAVSGANANALTAVTTTPSASGLTLSDGTNTLVITSAEVVLREIELKRDDVTACGGSGILATQALTAEGDDDPANHDAGDDHGDDDDDDGNDDDGRDDDERDACEKFETGPRLVSLPLDGSVSSQAITSVPAGTYDRLEFEIHKLSDDNGSDILRDRPDLADVSVRVVGTFNGTAFVFVSDDSFEQRVDLAPPIVVDADSGDINVTLAIDLARWFTGGQGMLINPTNAEASIEDAIDGTFTCFEDNDRDGDDDDDDERDRDDDDDSGDDSGVDDGGADDSADDDNSGSGSDD